MLYCWLLYYTVQAWQYKYGTSKYRYFAFEMPPPANITLKHYRYCCCCSLSAQPARMLWCDDDVAVSCCEM